MKQKILIKSYENFIKYAYKNKDVRTFEPKPSSRRRVLKLTKNLVDLDHMIYFLPHKYILLVKDIDKYFLNYFYKIPSILNPKRVK